MKILQFRGYVLFLSLGLVLFFLGALFVVIVRTKSSSTVTMPALVGKNYIQVHNELVRLRLKILIEDARIPEKNEGEVLSQSIAPGKDIEVGSHVYLTVNQGFDRVEIPNLKGQTLDRAKELLGKVLSGELYVSLPLGGVTYVPAEEGEAGNMVIDQIPTPGKSTHSGEKVYLLVTDPSTKKKQSSDKSTFINQPFPFVAKSLARKKIPWKIEKWEKTSWREETGLVTQESESSNGYQFVVKKAPMGNRLESGYEFLEWEAPSQEPFQIQLVKGENGELEDYLLPQPFSSGEKILLSFYRKGKMEVNLLSLSGTTVKKQIWDVD